MTSTPTTSIAESYALSSMQQGMLFDTVSRPNSGINIEQVVITIDEAVNTAAFKAAWEKVVVRHGALRTAFRWLKLAEPAQDVHPTVTLPFVERNWIHLAPEAQTKELEQFLRTDRKQGFDLSQAPVMRVTLARLGENRYKCIWSFHHIILDGRAYPIILNEVFTLYKAGLRNENIQLPAPRPFREYIEWVGRHDWQASEGFWRAELKGFSVPTDLRTLRPAAASNEFIPAASETRLSESLTTELKAFAAAQGVTLGTLVQAAWALLISRYSGEEDVVFGITRACRRSTVTDADSIVGIFINTLPLRVNVSSSATLKSWLKDLRAREFELRKHEHTPLVKIQQWSEIQDRKALFDTLLMFDHAQLDTAVQQLNPNGPKLQIELKEQVGIPLVLQAYGENQLLLRLEYNGGLYDEGTIGRMLGHLEIIFAGMLAGPEKQLGVLPLVTAAERKQLVVDWNEAPKDYPSDRCIHVLFEEQARRSPDAPALTCDDQTLSYRQLNAMANRLARELRSLGVGPDVLVGLCLERCNNLVIGLLAILKAGGAYLPIDLAYPADRLAFMLSDAKAPILLTQSSLLKDLPETSARVLCVDQLLQEKLTDADNENQPSATNPDHLAYVIYTSGTTGKPKGSLLTHRNVTRLFSATDHWYGFNSSDVWTLFHSVAFDFSVWEIWGALLYGGRLVVVPFMVSRSSEAFYELLAKEQVTVLNQTPSAFRQLIHAEESVGQKKLALRYVVFGGEALEMQSLRPWYDRHGDSQPRLVNMYGITETTVHVTYRPLSKDDLTSGSVIGVPIPDLQVYILDPQKQPLPIGVPGEMYVGGAGLARGYLNRQDLTDARFIPDHLTNKPGSRLYRTGDLARFLPGRDIEYLGRIDQQVKIRGFRVELGEIESVLCQHPAIREAVVIAREDVPGDQRLVAYVISSGGVIPSVLELREHLKKKMPEYMVPAAFVQLEKIPLTTNGKVDRKALPKPVQDRPDLGTTYVAPRNETEQGVCQVWREVLGVERISIHDDFFDLGGHSLLVLRAVSLLNDRFGTDLPPVALFRHRTVAGLATLLPSTSGQSAHVIDKPAAPSPAPSLNLPEANPEIVATLLGLQKTTTSQTGPTAGSRMKESAFCRWVLAPLFMNGSRRVRAFAQKLILKFENGEYYTVTLRKLYAKMFGIQIGDYTCGCFDVDRMREKTTIGRYSSVSPTAFIQNADHPRNTISTNAIFYHPAFGFAKGYELNRVKVEIGNDVFIGNNATILYPTKKIGDGAFIAAGSVIVEDVPPYAIVGGYPAKVLRYRFNPKTIETLLASKWWNASLENLNNVKDQFAQPLEGDKIR
ncbi:MAG: amino acid adenylation domain-containing protein [Nibricoccus sp.]